MRKIIPFLFGLLATAILINSCGNSTDAQSSPIHHDLPQIKDSNRLVALTLYSSTTYFIYRGEPMGFQYELAEQFARSLGVELEIKIAASDSFICTI